MFLINIGILSFLFFSKPAHPKKANLKNEIIRTLNLDERQIETYENLITQHNKIIQKTDIEIAQFKQLLYTSHFESNLNNAYLDSIAIKIKTIEQSHIAHFESIKNLCKKDQLKAYKLLSKKISTHFNHPKKKRKHDK